MEDGVGGGGVEQEGKGEGVGGRGATVEEWGVGGRGEGGPGWRSGGWDGVGVRVACGGLRRNDILVFFNPLRRGRPYIYGVWVGIWLVEFYGQEPEGEIALTNQKTLRIRYVVDRYFSGASRLPLALPY